MLDVIVLMKLSLIRPKQFTKDYSYINVLAVKSISLSYMFIWVLAI